MVEIWSYSNSDYNDVKRNLEEGNLFDATNDTRENLEKKIRTFPGSIIVAYHDGHVVGDVYITYDGWAAFIWHLAVRKEYRNKGIGKLLMQEAEKRLKEQGAKEVNIFINVDENKDLIDYYEKQGYKEFAKCISMYKRL